MMDRTKSFWTRQYQQHIGGMISLCYRYVPNRETAEDLAHSAFLQAIGKSDTFRGTGSFSKWLMRITVNTVLLYLRDNERKSIIDKQQDIEDMADRVADEEELNGEGEMDAILKANFTQEEIMEAIAELPENYRVVLNLYIFERYSHKQIAELRGISESTSKSHLLRARKKLQQILFEKSKRKKQPIMSLLILFPGSPTAVDRYCRRQLRGSAISPAHPLDIAAAVGNSPLPPALKFYTLRTPLVAGMGVAAAGAIGLATLSQPDSVPPSADPVPTAVEMTLDSTETPLPEIVVTEEPSAPQPMRQPIASQPIASQTAVPQSTASQPTMPQPVQSARVPASQPSTSSATISNDIQTAKATDSASVVVKKVQIKKMHTIIVKDTTKR